MILGVILGKEIGRQSSSSTGISQLTDFFIQFLYPSAGVMESAKLPCAVYSVANAGKTYDISASLSKNRDQQNVVLCAHWERSLLQNLSTFNSHVADGRLTDPKRIYTKKRAATRAEGAKVQKHFAHPGACLSSLAPSGTKPAPHALRA
jgi:hypothetical protein